MEPISQTELLLVIERAHKAIHAVLDTHGMMEITVFSPEEKTEALEELKEIYISMWQYR